MRLHGFVAMLALLVVAEPALMHGQQCASGTATLPIECQGSGGCSTILVSNFAKSNGIGLYGEKSATVDCHQGTGCYAFYTAVSGSCLAEALNKPNIRRNLEQLAQESPIPILVASCTGGLVAFHSSGSSDIGSRPLDVDRQILKDSISHDNQRRGGE